MASADFVFFSWNRTQQNHETLRRTCLTRSGLTVVCGCRMLTGSVFWVLWGISLTFSAMKSWTPFSASTVPWIRHTRSVVPANTHTHKRRQTGQNTSSSKEHTFSVSCWYESTQTGNAGKSMNDIAAHYRCRWLINVLCVNFHTTVFLYLRSFFCDLLQQLGVNSQRAAEGLIPCRSRCPSFDSNSRSSRQNCSNFIIIQCAVE